MSEERTTYLCSLSAQELRIGNWVRSPSYTQLQNAYFMATGEELEIQP